MDDTYERLSVAFAFSKIREIFWEVIEILLGLFTGGLIADWFAEDDPSTWVSAGIIICVIMLVPLTISRLLKSSYFPNTVVQYLKAREDLIILTRELDRKKNIEVFIDEAIQALNNNTCPFQGEDNGFDAFCDNPLDDGIATVFKPIIERTHYILDCNKAKFTVAAHFHFYPEKVPVPNVPKGYTVNPISKTLVFRDDLKISHVLTDDILEDIYATGLKFHIHSIALGAYNHIKLKHELIQEENIKVKLIAAPIPAVCEDNKIGVLLIFSEGDVCTPKDLENTLLIFGRIVANWISKYEDCINRRRTSLAAELPAAPQV